MTVSPSTTVADLVVERPARARLFEQLGLDYCCGGKRSLEDACRAKGLDVTTVAAVLGALDGDGEAHADLAGATPSELVDHIVTVHHDRLRAELPRLGGLLAKASKAHAAERPELPEVLATFEELRAELDEHLAAEEAEAFPACRAIERGEAVDDVEPRLAALEDDHAEVAKLLERLADLTGGYDLGDVRCNTHRAALDGLAELQRDLHLHIHEENNLLFPRVEALL